MPAYTEKKCIKCGESKPATNRYFYKLNNGVFGLMDTCKNCGVASKKRNSKNEVLNRYKINQNGCWVYTHKKDSAGYGIFYFQSTKYLAHRISYEIANGEIPDGLVLDHTCKNRSCINPNHLDAVTQAENVRRTWLPPHCSTCKCKEI